jgi:hypothetical protein
MWMLWINHLAARELLVSLGIFQACNSHNSSMKNRNSKLYCVYKGVSLAELIHVQPETLTLNFQ